MRTVLIPGTVFTLTLAIVLGAALPAVLSAEVILRPHDSKAAERPVRLHEIRSGSLDVPAVKADLPAVTLFVPFYEVDTRHPSGTTTLYAVRNTTGQTIDLVIQYKSASGDVWREDRVSLGPWKTLTTNVRDVSGLPAGIFGFASGYIKIEVDADERPEVLVGDFLQVDPGNNFATGDRMVGFEDLCHELQVRFLDFGIPTKLRFLIDFPLGADPDSDPPTMTLKPFDEQGNGMPWTDVYTDQHALYINASFLSSEPFGTLVVDFNARDFVSWVNGMVYAEYAAEGRYSVGMNGACMKP